MGVVIVDQTRELIFNVMQDQAYKLCKDDNGNDIKTKTQSDEDRVEDRSWPAMDADIRQLRLKEQGRRLTVEQTIFGGLRFQTMTDRHDGIVEAHERTFEWIFDMSSKETRWSNFIDWLRDEDGVYWVNGKAGSGKSTLMRYIYDNPKTKEVLRAWAAEVPLSIAGLFFWNSGTVEQRSYIGLLRSLIYEVLHQQRDLISVVFPGRWATEYSQFFSPTLLDREPWTLPDLVQSFKMLMRQQVTPLELCLFIDGLDEYDGEYEMIAELMKSAANSNSVKVCASSRPLLVFEDAFRTSPTLRLQDLTFDDISNYVRDRLDNDARFRRLAQEDPQTVFKLVEEIVTKADGGFLWVRLVVKSLLDGLSNRDSISDLQRRLRLLPPDLEGLYTHMLDLIDGFYVVKASEMFQIVRAAREQGENARNVGVEPEPLSCLALSFADEEDPNFSINAPLGEISQKKTPDRCQLMADRLKCRCAGLLETQGFDNIYSGPSLASNATSEAKIQYLHRTVKDYLDQTQVWTRIISHTEGTDFSPHCSLLRSCLMQLKTLPSLQYGEKLWLIATAALEYAHSADDNTGKANVALLEEIDRVMTFHLRKGWRDEKHHWASYRTPMQQYDRTLNWNGSLLSLGVQYGANPRASWMSKYGSRSAMSVISDSFMDDYPEETNKLIQTLKTSNRWNRVSLVGDGRNKDSSVQGANVHVSIFRRLLRFFRLGKYHH